MPTNKAIIITGVKDIDKRLKSLEPRLQRKVIRQSMRAGLKVLAAEVKAQAPVLTGATKAAVQVRAVKKRKRGSIELEVRIKGDDRTIKEGGDGGPVFVPAIVEYGRLGVAPDPFMRRAYEAAGESARGTTIDGIRRGIESEASR